jgi:serine protease Do
MSASMWSAMTPGALSLPTPDDVVPASRPPEAPYAPSAPLPAPGPPAPAESPKETSGTGFFVSPQGHVLTNAHVVDGCQTVQLIGPNGLSIVRIVAKDSTNDLALLKSLLGPPKVAQLRTGVRLGEQVAAFGYPLLGVLSTTGNFTLGNVTSLTGVREPGNSGGPLLDEVATLWASYRSSSRRCALWSPRMAISRKT